ncbi:MAG: GlxA family transcriptional regulator [Acidimicrobiia bacterium]
MHSVVVLLFEPVSMFETSVACEVFGLDRTDMGVPRYGFSMCTPTPGPLATKDHGCVLHVEHGLRALSRADTIIVPGFSTGLDPVPPAAAEGLRRAHARGARIVSFCSGSFVLAKSGLLDGRRAATHWMHAARMAEMFPEIEVDDSVLYVDDGSGIYTSAGTAAAIDLCLHLMRIDHGAEVANVVARRMVMPPHRDGGQAQYVQPPVPDVPEGDPMAATMAWAVKHLDRDLTVEQLAARAKQSPRTFARRFRSATGTTPLQWLLRQRVLHAQRLLESTDLPVEIVAVHCGFGSAAAMRQHFSRITGTSPAAYRRTFSCTG